MFVCECECVTDHAVVCVQTGVCVCVCVWSRGCRHDSVVGAEQHAGLHACCDVSE